MARVLRVQWEGCWYHITSRGNERKTIFRKDEDRLHFLGLLSEMTERFQTRLHVYTLMDNHYHLLLETLEANLVQAMQWLNSGYSGWFNRHHRRHGHLLQGRYQGIVVEPERWGLELSRYVHLNPIRVKGFDLGKKAQQQNRAGVGRELRGKAWRAQIEYLRSYRWSSYRAYIGLHAMPPWLTCREVLKWMGRAPERRPKAYREYVESAAREGLKQTPWEELRGLRKRADFARVVEVVEELRGERWQQFADRRGDWGRDLVLSLARQHCGLTLNELGKKIGMDRYSAVSKAIIRFQERLQSDAKLRALQHQANSVLSYVQV